ncbi:hypothetical protein HWV62_38777 [Athelia sp. TMB]|nr:hypothetical protein HWV62_38777 [Athelia sp. TMB]
MSTQHAPLRGDALGRYKIQIVGNSGTGKSTLGRWLAAELRIPFFALDEIYWRPGWQDTPMDEFRVKVAAVMDAHPDGWIIDGDYKRPMKDLVSGAATDIIWLDPPLVLYFPRLVLRTARRLFGRAPPCAAGCQEEWPECITRKGILWWALTNHAVVRTRYGAAGFEHGGKLHRLGGWGGALAGWKREVRVLAASAR